MFVCDRASGIKITEFDQTVYTVTEKQEGGYFIDYTAAVNIQRVTPICTNSNQKNCIIQEQLDPEYAYLVSYINKIGVIETSNLLGGGFYSEIIHDISSVEYTKSWEGQITFEPISKVLTSSRSILSDTNLHQYTIIDDNNCTIYFKYGSFNIPISRVLLEEDPNSLMQAIGINSEYNPEYIKINDYGQVTFPIDVCGAPMTDTSLLNPSYAINLPISYFSNYSLHYLNNSQVEYTESEYESSLELESDLASEFNSKSISSNNENNEEPSGSSNSNTGSSNNNTTVIAVSVVIVIIVLVAAAVVGFFIYKKVKAKEYDSSDSEQNIVSKPFNI